MTSQRRILRRPHLWGLLWGLTLAVAQFFTPMGMGAAQAATTNCTPNGLVQDCTITFDFTGAAETWTVPPGVTQATFDLYGAQGGTTATYGGRGGRVTATLTVAAGATYQILVGGYPGNSATPGFNGGGARGSSSGGGGGGASDVRTGAFALANRILVAGGGGGGTSVLSILGGAGGYPNGGDGASPGFDAGGGRGGTQTAGGAGGFGTNPINNGSAGGLGQGGNGGAGGYSSGGGGGYYGGGGGGVNSGDTYGGGGGGGSSFGPTGATFQNGVREGNGLVVINYTQSDTLAPVANPTQSPAPAPSGWNNTIVTVIWNWSDNGSGIDPANCTSSSVSSGSGIVTVTATCRDLAGNVGSATYQVLVDPTAPTANPSQTPPANAAGWNNSDVTVNWNWGFTGAIIDTANCTNISTSSGEGALTLSATCRDVALNQRTVTYQVKVDKTAPVVTVTGVSDGATYPAGSVPAAACSTSDALSGVATQAVVSVTGGNGDGTGNFTAICSGATDLADNSAAAISVSYSVTLLPDSSAPVITPSVVGTQGNNGWYVSDVMVSWSVVDEESAISSQSGCETQNITSDTASVTFTCSASSTGGSSSQSVTIQRDATAPVVTVNGVSDGAGYPLGGVPTAGCTTTDALSGVATQATLSLTGGNANGTGSFTATCSGATDNAGNSGSVSVTYSVGYNWSGFLQPVDNLPVVNTANAGQAIPVKFSLGGDFGLNILASGYPAAQAVSCGGGGGESNPIEETATPGNSTLQYDPATQVYTYVWKTDKAWSGTCR